MRNIGFVLALGVTLASAIPSAASAGGAIANACMRSERGAGSAQLCGCIQKVADAVLSPGDQNRGAQIFLEPHKSQEIRASARRADAVFWEKWQVFGASAAQYCE